MSPALTLLLGLALGAPEPTMSTPLPDQRMIVAHTRLELLRSETPLPPGPFADLQAALLATPGAHLGYAFSPRGRALGLVATGSGEALTATVSGILKKLTDARAASMFRALATLQGHEIIRLEVVLGAPSHIRAGVRGFDDVRARVVLDEEGFPVSERDRLLGTGGVVGMDVISDGVAPPTLGVVAREAAKGEGLDGARAIEVTRIAGAPSTHLIRRTGLRDRALIEWMVGSGAGGVEAARKLGPVHGSLGLQGPDEIGWTAGALSDSVLFYYRPLPLP